MAVTWIEKKGLAKALASAGYAKNHINGTCYITNEQGFSSEQIDNEAQVIINSYSELPTLKAEKLTELKAEGLGRIQVTFPSISDFDELKLIREQFLSIAPAARNPTPDFQLLIDTYSAGKSAIDAINALATSADVTGYDVVNTPTWP